jgi:chromosome segregation ATPase
MLSGQQRSIRPLRFRAGTLKQTKMKTLQECKDEVAKRNGFESWDNIRPNYEGRYFDEVAELYAEQFKRQSRIWEISSDGLQAKLDACKEEVWRLQQMVTTWSERHSDREKEIKQINEENRTLKARCIGLQEDVATLEAKVKELEDTLWLKYSSQP